MHILVINPNSTETMTRSIETAARAAARHPTRISATNPTDAPPAIQGPADGDAAVPPLVRVFEREVFEKGGYDAVIIACFDDTGLRTLQQRSPIPVIGIGQAAFHAAMLIGNTFSVVTTLSVSVPVIEANLEAYGMAARCRRVRASEVPVLDLESARDQSHATIAEEISSAIAEDNADAIVLGCAGMADLAADMSDRFKMPVIDGVVSAIAFAEALRSANVDRWSGQAARRVRP